MHPVADLKPEIAVRNIDIIAALNPLVDEYFLGTCEQQGAALCYTLPDGRKFRIAAGEIG